MFGSKKNRYTQEPSSLRRRFHHFLLRQRRKPGSTPKHVRSSMPLKKSQRMNHVARSAIKRTVLITIIFLSFGSGIYLAFFSELFIIKEIKTEKNGAAVSVTQLAPFFDALKGKRLFFAETQTLAKDVEKAFRNKILFVEVKKSYPNRIIVKINEYPAVLTLHVKSPEKEQYLVLNQIGHVIGEKNEYKDIPLVSLQSAKPLKTTDTIISETALATMSSAFTQFTELFGLKITGGEWKKIERELHLTTEKNFTVWLDLTTDIETQLRKLKRALVKLDIYKESLEYIDLRIAGGGSEKVIFKRKR